MSKLNIAAIQLTSTSSWQANLTQVERLIQQAADQKARLIVLPENVFLFDGKSMRSLAESDAQNTILDRVKAMARAHQVYIIIGSHPAVCDEKGQYVSAQRVRQACWVISSDGECVARYDKIHLFDVDVDDKAARYRESDYIEPGDLTPKTIMVDGVNVGLSICYDLRFPELYRELTKMGAELIVVPAAFTYVTGKAHWNTLLAARAIENQCFVLGVNQCGWHNPTRQTYGHSALYSPMGEKLFCLKEEPGVFVYEIDNEEVEVCRAKMPCMTHRRL